MKKSEYEIQAEEFAAKHGVTMTADYKGHYARPDWEYATAQFLITLKRQDKSYSFDYSDSINNSWKFSECSKPYTFHQGLPPGLSQENWPKDGKPKDFTRYSIKPFIPKPRIYDILSCLQKYDPGSHEDFCSDFGYNPDSRKGLDTYLAVQLEWHNVERLFGDCLDELCEIN